MFAGTNEIWISSDKRTKVRYDPGTGDLNIHVNDVVVLRLDAVDGLVVAAGSLTIGNTVLDEATLIALIESLD